MKGIDYYWDEVKDAFISKGERLVVQNGVDIWKTFPEESDEIVPFCSERCRFEYICSPVCPKCGACEKHLLRKEAGESMWPIPEKMVEYGKVAKRIATLRVSLACGEKEIEEKIQTELQVFKRMEKELYLPILCCKECQEACEPRSPYWMYRMSTLSAFASNDLRQPSAKALLQS